MEKINADTTHIEIFSKRNQEKDWNNLKFKKRKIEKEQTELCKNFIQYEVQKNLKFFKLKFYFIKRIKLLKTMIYYLKLIS